jgi:hypothetical protein
MLGKVIRHGIGQSRVDRCCRDHTL